MKAKLYQIITIACAIAVLMPYMTMAKSSFNEDFYSSNDILYYKPDDEVCSVGSETTDISPEAAGNVLGNAIKASLDYLNREVFNKKELETIRANAPVYKSAADKVGIPWEMLAVVHKRESGLGKVNPKNGQGVYQFLDKEGGPYKTGPISDQEFQRQTGYAAQFLKKAAGKYASGLSKGDSNAIKYVFFTYNGRAPKYKEQARRLGFSEEQAEIGEGSPYVMNKADAKREPYIGGDKKNGTNHKWGQVKVDHGPVESPANADHGAFVMYASLRGKISPQSTDGTTNCTPENNDNNQSNPSGPVSSQGLTKEQAIQLAKNYGANKNGYSRKMAGPAYWAYCGGHGSNCVTFSKFFNAAFTDIPTTGRMGNGVDVVKNMRAKGAKTGSEPKAFATFSWGDGGAGHTGIVLGVHGDTVIVGQASCSAGTQKGAKGAGSGTKWGDGAAYVMIGKKNDPKVWQGVVPKEFAYPSSVDTAKIQKFIADGEVK